ncbi:MAG: hypothetical protein PHI11_12195 [Gallionella sp.]|nr:hypothetical protein [Gallionella sp.]
MKNRYLIIILLGISAQAFAETSVSGIAAPHAHGEHAGHHDQRSGNLPTAWTTLPMLMVKLRGEARGNVSIVPQNIVADRIDAYSNATTSPSRPLPLDMAGAQLDKPASGGFHWLTAREEQGNQVRVASTVYYFSHPGKNPTTMFLKPKNELELIPQPFPREHSRYRANEDWQFLVRFNNQPLPQHAVQLLTQNGTTSTFTSDAEGVVTVRFPNDFKAENTPAAGQHSHERRNSSFVLASEQRQGDKSYLTSFNGQYGADAFDQRDLGMGLGFVVLGMLSALPLLRQRGKKETASC